MWIAAKQEIDLTGGTWIAHVDIMMLSFGGWYVGEQSPQLNPWCYKTWGKVDKTFGCTVKLDKWPKYEKLLDITWSGEWTHSLPSS